MVEHAEKQGIEVAIASIPPTSEFVWAPNTEPKVRIPALNKALKAYAEQHNWSTSIILRLWLIQSTV